MQAYHMSHFIGDWKARDQRALNLSSFLSSTCSGLGQWRLGGERLSHRLIVLFLLGMAAGAGGRVP